MKNLNTWVKFNKVDDKYGTFEMSPLERGMGLTVGNSLRRVILSSIEGVAVTSLLVEGARHEFDVIEGVHEDILDIIFNIKSIVFSMSGDEGETRTITLDAKGEKDVLASDLTLPPDVTLCNPDQHILSISARDVSIRLEFNIEKNVGYRASENQNKEDSDVSRIFLDSSFSPIERVNHIVEDTRVGQDLNYDKLTIELWSNGSVTIEDCMKRAASNLMDILSLFGELNRRPVFEDADLSESPDVSDTDNEMNKIYDSAVENLELSARSLNCLKKANINTIGELIKKGPDELRSIKNFGDKSEQEINSKLKEYNLSLNFSVVSGDTNEA